MSDEAKNVLICDLPELVGEGVREQIEVRESAGDYLYAIDAGIFVYVIENGQLTASARYGVTPYHSADQVQSKPVSDATLTTMRKYGYVPPYDQIQ